MPTEAAIKEINALRASHSSWRDVSQHAAALSPAAQALARVLRRPGATDTITAYVTASAAAVEAQKQHRGVGKYSAWFGFAATTVSGLLLFLQWKTDTWNGTALYAVHMLCLGSALLAALVLWLRRPGDAWGKARSRSEGTRLSHFEAIREAESHAGAVGPNELPFMVLVLEYTRAYLVEDQRNWHAKESVKVKWAARWIAALRWLGVLLLLVAFLPAASDIVLSRAGSAPSGIANLATVVKAWMGPNGAALAGLLGGALQTLAANLAALSLAERNRRSYTRIAEVLTHYLGKPLDDARTAAAGGKHRGVDRYLWAVRTELIAENRAWNEALGMSSDFVLDELPRAGRGQ
jgi:hypothetical protein